MAFVGVHSSIFGRGPNHIFRPLNFESLSPDCVAKFGLCVPNLGTLTVQRVLCVTLKLDTHGQNS